MAVAVKQERGGQLRTKQRKKRWGIEESDSERSNPRGKPGSRSQKNICLQGELGSCIRQLRSDFWPRAAPAVCVRQGAVQCSGCDSWNEGAGWVLRRSHRPSLSYYTPERVSDSLLPLSPLLVLMTQLHPYRPLFFLKQIYRLGHHLTFFHKMLRVFTTEASFFSVAGTQ